MEDTASLLSSVKSDLKSALKSDLTSEHKGAEAVNESRRSQDSDKRLRSAHSSSIASRLEVSHEARAASRIRDFTNYEDPTDPVFFTGERRESYKYRWLFVLSYLSMSMSVAAYWRYPSVFLYFMGDSDGLSSTFYGIWNFLTPWALALVCVGWPVLIAESATADLARGGAMQVFGSVGKRFRCVGMTFLVALTVSTFVPQIVADSFSHMIYSFKDGALGYISYDSVEGVSCLGYDRNGANRSFPCFNRDGPPPASRRVLLDTNITTSLRNGELVDYYAELSASDGISQCRGDPGWMWKTHYSDLLHCVGFSVYQVDTGINSFDDFGDISAGNYNNRELATTNAEWEFFGLPFSAPKTVGICVAWIVAAAFCLMGHRYMQWVRPVLLVFGVVMFICGLVIGGSGASSVSHDTGGVPEFSEMFKKINSTSLKDPAHWAYSINQALYGLSLCVGMVPEFSFNAGRFTENLVVDNSWYMLCSSLFSMGWGFIVLCGALIGGRIISPGREGVESNPTGGSMLVKQMVNAYPGQELFVGLGAAFTTYNSGKNASAWSFCFYFCFFLLGCNEMSGILQSIITGFAGNDLNSSFAIRGALTCGFALLCLAFNIILAWAIGLPFAVAFCHYAIEILLPFMTYIEMTTIGWFINWKWFCYHMGKAAAWTQLVVYTLGIWLAGLGTAFLWNYGEESWKHWICVLLGAVLVLLSVLIPPLFAKSKDPDNTHQSLWFRYKFMFWGKVEMLRNQINVTCCHTTKFWRLTPLWTILIRYVVPFACVFATCLPLCTLAGNIYYSPYFPYLIDYSVLASFNYDMSTAPVYVLVCAVILPLTTLVLLLFFVILPSLLGTLGCTPKSTLEYYFLPVDAETEFARRPETQMHLVSVSD